MAKSPVEVVKAILDNPTDLASVRTLVTPDATYVSLNDDNPELRKIMPWAGTQKGPEAITSTYARVGRFWSNEAFEIRDMFGEGENVAVFGRFTYRSTTFGKAVTSPFSHSRQGSGRQGDMHAVHGGHVRHGVHLPYGRDGHVSK